MHPEHTADVGSNHGYAHVMPVGILIATFLALVGLTILTVYQSNLALGQIAFAVAMAIATVKAALVLVFFMHLRHEKAFNIMVIAFSLVFVAVFLAYTTMDSAAYAPEIEARNYELP